MLRMRRFALLAALLLCACSSMPKERHASPSYASPQDTPGTLSALLSPSRTANPDLSGLALLQDPRHALQARLAMAAMAEHTLDLQYYIWHGDQSGLALLQAVLQAAERGVRVRILLDDHTLKNADAPLAQLAQLPNLEIKLYNPYGKRRSGSFARTLAFLGEFNRLNHRMHNKVMVADNQLAIVGGRNIGDEYFGLSAHSNFQDLDVFVAGHAVRDLSSSFDLYWNSNWAISAASIWRHSLNKLNPPAPADPAIIQAKLAKGRAQFPASPYPLELDRHQVSAELADLPDRLYWGVAVVTADPPRKDLAKQPSATAVSELLSSLGQSAAEEILISAPYFVPESLTLKGIQQLTDNGVEIKVLTNSLQASDVKVAHYGYVVRRQQALDSGAQLFEYRPDARSGQQTQPASARNVPLALHAKVAVYDRKRVYIGSANLDPRSLWLNTEIGLIVDDPHFATEVAQLLLRDMSAHSAYQLERHGEQLCWRALTEGSVQIVCQEPGLRWRDCIGIWLNRILPIEQQL
ncbi:phospholipase D family protein [Ferrimonas pelagia]|uniref:Phospholipase D family protein n=1 Tax=Ferrimonas pelagia TaxID=1177826 RepID=A0ABP9EPJ0_9GAMM